MGSTGSSAADSTAAQTTPAGQTGDGERMYITWLNVWDGSTEGWWSKNNSSGVTVPYEGLSTTTKSLNWGDATLREYYMKQVYEAGIDAVVLDLTNGVGWDAACRDVFLYAKEYGMKVAAAVHDGTAQAFDDKARQIWQKYAQDSSSYSDTYLHKDGKPLLVAYVGKSLWDTMSRNPGEYASKFTVVWASGEDSAADKWGWQSPAKDGPQESADSMHITPSVNWTAPSWSMTGWRKSLAYLDYGFMLAKKNETKYNIVGSFDDVRERNGWMKMDTTAASFNHRILAANSADTAGTPGMIMRDVDGNVSTDAYYNRVREWTTTGTAKPFHDGGSLADGVYTLVNKGTGKSVGGVNPSAYNPETGSGYAEITEASYARERAGEDALVSDTAEYQQYVFFYHLGGDEYRLVRLCTGFSMEEASGRVVHNWDSASDAQKWKLQKEGDGYLLVNAGSGKALALSGDAVVTAAANAADAAQLWTLNPIITLD